MVTFEEMNDYSRRFAARLFEEHPGLTRRQVEAEIAKPFWQV